MNLSLKQLTHNGIKVKVAEVAPSGSRVLKLNSEGKFSKPLTNGNKLEIRVAVSQLAHPRAVMLVNGTTFTPLDGQLDESLIEKEYVQTLVCDGTQHITIACVNGAVELIKITPSSQGIRVVNRQLDYTEESGIVRCPTLRPEVMALINTQSPLQ